MYLIDLIKRSLRSLTSAKTRTLLTAFAIAVGTFALALTLAARNGAQDYANSIIKNNFDPTELIVTRDSSLFTTTDASKPQVYNQSFGNITSARGVATQVQMLTDADITQLSQTPGVQSVTPVISLALQYLTRDGQRKYVATMEVYNPYQNPTLLAGTIPKNIPNNTIILPEGFLNVLGFSNAQDAIGKVVRVAVQKLSSQTYSINQLLKSQSVSPDSTNSTENSFKVIAVYKTPSTLIQASTGLYLYGNSNDVNRLNDYITQGTTSYHKYLSAFVKVTNGTNITNLNRVQASIRKLGYTAQSVLDTEKTLTQVIGVLQGIVIVFGLIAVIASVFGVINTMYISVLQRTKEIGLMKAMGMHKKDVNKLFIMEAALIGLLGGVIGSITAIIIGIILNPFISNQLSLGGSKLLVFSFIQISVLIISLIVVTMIAGLLPARKASRLDPIEALRTE